MDDIVVIILTLIVAVFGFLNKSRKKNSTPEGSSSSSGKAQDFWDMLMDNNEESPYEQQTQVVFDEIEEKEPVQEARPKYEFSTEKKKSEPLQRRKKPVKKSKARAMVMGEKFSLKKAVIYSEIINRKYV